jgi:phospholipid:diacylglycerol acyltransferase
MTIETTIKMNGGEKVIIVPHSMGCVFLMYFLKWVEYPAPLGKTRG